MQSKSITLLFPVFGNYELTIIFSPDIRKTVKKLKAGKLSKSALACYLSDKAKPGYAWIVFPEQPSHEAITHESWHAIYGMLKWIGAEIEDEVVAYHLGYTVEKIYEHLEGKHGSNTNVPENFSE